MISLRRLIAAACIALSPISASAAVLYANPGGDIAKFEKRFAQLAKSGEPVQVADMCASACTMVTGYVRRDRLCFGEHAYLMFHAAFHPKFKWQWRGFRPVRVPYWDGRKSTISQEGIKEMMSHYPADVRAWIKAQGGLTTPANHLILKGPELFAMFRHCSGVSNRVAQN